MNELMNNERERLEVLVELAKESRNHVSPSPQEDTKIRVMPELNKALDQTAARKKAAQQYDIIKPYDL